MEFFGTLVDREASVRVGTFLTLLVVFGAVELFVPRRTLRRSKVVRWSGNLGLSLINNLTLRLAFPILAMGMADLARRNGWGLFNNLNVPQAVALVTTLVALDLVIYLQHAVFHRVPLLWRLHRVHHTDIELDVSSAVRIHVAEIVISIGIKLLAVAVLGAPVLAVLLFEIWLNATSMFHHSNLRIPTNVDRWLRWVIVTPDMHRVHHSILADETNSNFAFNLPWWDRLLGTYRAQPRGGHEAMTIGLPNFREPRDQHLDRLLIQPLFSEQRADRPVHESPTSTAYVRS